MEKRNRKRMKRWQKWAIGTGTALVVLAVIGYVGMNYAISYTLKAFSGSLDEIASAEDAVGTDPSGSPAPDKQGNANEDAAAGNGTDAEDGNAVGGGTAGDDGAAAGQSGTDQPGSANEAQADRPAGSGNAKSDGSAGGKSDAAGSSSGTDNFSYSPEVSTDKAKAVEDSITLGEKTKVSTILLKKLSPADIKTFMAMAGGGMSLEEKKAAKKVIMDKLSEDEYNELIAIAAKYGLSEGKQYADTSR